VAKGLTCKKHFPSEVAIDFGHARFARWAGQSETGSHLPRGEDLKDPARMAGIRRPKHSPLREIVIAESLNECAADPEGRFDRLLHRHRLAS
jgi:hypothetical protein